MVMKMVMTRPAASRVEWMLVQWRSYISENNPVRSMAAGWLPTYGLIWSQSSSLRVTGTFLLAAIIYSSVELERKTGGDISNCHGQLHACLTALVTCSWRAVDTLLCILNISSHDFICRSLHNEVNAIKELHFPLVSCLFLWYSRSDFSLCLHKKSAEFKCENIQVNLSIYISDRSLWNCLVFLNTGDRPSSMPGCPLLVCQL